MSTLRCFILDDLPSQFKALEIMINNHKELLLVGTSSSPADFLKEVDNGLNIDLLFLDIEMPGISGLEIADLLKGKTKIIFTTAYQEFALEAFSLNVVDYLVKPIRQERFDQAMEKVFKLILADQVSILDQNITIPGKNKGNYIKIRLGDVCYITSDSNYMTAIVKEKRYIFISSLEKIDEQFPSNHFIRVHRSYLINMNKITSIQGNLVYMENGDKIPIGRTYRKTVLPILVSLKC
ncbi:LytTR family DNA-binding domain-containing protein [Sphingobacterium siyangense]|uniref:LytR/AlgR family response regulator transcription factor n=1 Tax=Sphingobacterium siyangense TaxID=459529 RepID=UPI002FDA52B9